MSNTQNKYRIDTPENRAFLAANAEDLLRFGHRFPSPEGGSYYLGDDGTPWKDRNRETWITARMCHVYSLGVLLGHPGSAELADAALRGLRGELHDMENGGWYSGRTAEGGILPGKQCYAHAFVILAASSAVLAGRPGAQELLDEAIALYDKRFWNEEEGLACDTWNTEFTELDSYRGLNANMHTVEAFLAASDVTGSPKYRTRAGRIINRVLKWAEDNDWRIPEHYRSDWQPDLLCNIDKPDDPFKPFGATPGHGIEWARLITQWTLSTFGEEYAVTEGKPGDGAVPSDFEAEHTAFAAEHAGFGRKIAGFETEHTSFGRKTAGSETEHTGSGRKLAGSETEHAGSGSGGVASWDTANDCPLASAARYKAVNDRIKEKAAYYITAAECLFNRAVLDGWNADGAPGIVYTTDWEGNPVVHDRMHWTLAEAINTSACLYHVTGKESYAALYEVFMQYLDTTVMDHVNGSWFHQLDRENHLLRTVWPGKSDLYHALQAMLIPYYAADLSIAPAVKLGKKI